MPDQAHVSWSRVPEECPDDVEAMIARCLDNDPANRPSARELVEFMVALPAQLSRDGLGPAASADLTTGAGKPFLHEQQQTCQQHPREMDQNSKNSQRVCLLCCVQPQPAAPAAWATPARPHRRTSWTGVAA